ncbi:unnamed protein product [Diamesa hyperborea]
MFLKVLVFVGFVASSSVLSSAVECPRIPTHYEELGCTPIQTSAESCPTSYDCSTFLNRDPTKCYFKNQVINPGSYIQESALKGLCVPGCHCQIRDGKASFMCAHYDCFNWSPAKENCFINNTLDDCCRGQEVCGKTPLATCNVQGITYKEGDKIYPENTCYKCVCTSDFEDNVPIEQNKNCRKLECGIELHSAAKLKDGCAPVYGKDRCCPYYWHCPSNTDVVVKANTSRKSGETCKFGQLTLQVGDQINVDSKKSCSCIHPPMIECKHLSD